MAQLKCWTLISRQSWSEVHEIISSNPKEAHSWENGYLPIHYACCFASVPVNVIEALIKAHPRSVALKSKSSDELPLHYAIRRESSTIIDVIKMLLQYYKEGASVSNYLGHTPLCYHIYSSLSPSLEIVKMLVEAHPDSVRICDKHQWYPLHCATVRGDWEITEYLINLYPDALLQKNSCDRTPRDVANHNRQYGLYIILRDEEEMRFGTNRVKSPTPSTKKIGREGRSKNVVDYSNMRCGDKYSGKREHNKVIVDYSDFLDEHDNTSIHSDVSL